MGGKSSSPAHKMAEPGFEATQITNHFAYLKKLAVQ